MDRGVRRGFTLIELMVVITVIAILASFVVPAVSRALFAGENTQVIAEVKLLEKALLDFKNEYGSYPPSHFVLHEDMAGWFGDLTLTGDAAIRRANSERLIRRIFGEEYTPPQLPGSTTSMTNPPIAFYDIDGDGLLAGESDYDPSNDYSSDDEIVLNGAECLVFFLGGMQALSPEGTRIPVGFSKNRLNPFTIVSGGNRDKPLFEFDNSRFIDVDGDGLQEYHDQYSGQETPYVYLSAYDGSGYRVEGLDGVIGTIDDETITVDAASLTGPSDGVYERLIGPRYAYYKVDNAAAGSAALFEPWNSETFQLFSPGNDRTFGTGGAYDPSQGFAIKAAAKHFGALGNLEPADKSMSDGTNLVRQISFEQDNIVNFSNSRLN